MYEAEIKIGAGLAISEIIVEKGYKVADDEGIVVNELWDMTTISVLKPAIGRHFLGLAITHPRGEQLGSFFLEAETRGTAIGNEAADEQAIRIRRKFQESPDKWFVEVYGKGSLKPMSDLVAEVSKKLNKAIDIELVLANPAEERRHFDYEQ